MLDPTVMGGVVAVGGAVGYTALIAAIGAMLSRRSRSLPPIPQAPASVPPPPIDLNHALDTVLVKAMESQTGMMERLQKLNIENAQLAIDSIQRREKRKGGFKRAATAGRTVAGTFERNCRLCIDGNISDPTPAEIIAHSTHRQHRKPRSAAVAVEDKGSHILAHVDARSVEVGPDGTEQIECPDCATNGTNHAEH